MDFMCKNWKQRIVLQKTLRQVGAFRRVLFLGDSSIIFCCFEEGHFSGYFWYMVFRGSVTVASRVRSKKRNTHTRHTFRCATCVLFFYARYILKTIWACAVCVCAHRSIIFRATLSFFFCFSLCVVHCCEREARWNEKRGVHFVYAEEELVLLGSNLHRTHTGVMIYDFFFFGQKKKK